MHLVSDKYTGVRKNPWYKKINIYLSGYCVIALLKTGKY